MTTTANKQAEITRKLRGAMTVAQLIEHLEGCNPEAQVVFTCDYGDYHHTRQALLVRQVVEMAPESECLVASAYSHSGLAVEDVEFDADGEAAEELSDEERTALVAELAASHREVVILQSELQ